MMGELWGDRFSFLEELGDEEHIADRWAVGVCGGVAKCTRGGCERDLDGSIQFSGHERAAPATRFGSGILIW